MKKSQIYERYKRFSDAGWCKCVVEGRTYFEEKKVYKFLTLFDKYI
jgi:hypothetical protein